ncbi:predicted protein [Coccidioides posadasii str. Silveira]|uniref:Predicted protein n=2 Tax=Coccidioides posadasii TaxID=199306 RepID=E9D0U4_COCPS|nr:predicted protein [Coccidioides posadasii str. Silveira]KMM73482.1 hypothetical protein CPAG_09771 [Coccidioides posadasii RMSCC 3488]
MLGQKKTASFPKFEALGHRHTQGRIWNRSTYHLETSAWPATPAVSVRAFVPGYPSGVPRIPQRGKACAGLAGLKKVDTRPKCGLGSCSVIHPLVQDKVRADPTRPTHE